MFRDQLWADHIANFVRNQLKNKVSYVESVLNLPQPHAGTHTPIVIQFYRKFELRSIQIHRRPDALTRPIIFNVYANTSPLLIEVNIKPDVDMNLILKNTTIELFIDCMVLQIIDFRPEMHVEIASKSAIWLLVYGAQWCGL